MTPRSVTTAGEVVAQANAAIIIPGQSGTARFDPTKPLVNPGGGSKTIVLKFVDPATGKAAGAKDLILPLEPSTDWTANDRRDGLGTDYTYFDSLSFSVAVTASEAQISVRNTALGPLWLTKLQVRGKLITSYDPLQVTLEDTDSQAAYGPSRSPITCWRGSRPRLTGSNAWRPASTRSAGAACSPSRSVTCWP
jgi:hypothetical protein